MEELEPLVSGQAFKAMLSHIHPEQRIAALKEQLKTTKSVSKRDDLIKKIKYLDGLQKTGLDAANAYVIHNVPVVPPQMRPVMIKGGNRLEFSDLNLLYKEHMVVNNSLKDTIDKVLPEELIKERDQSYQGLKAIVGLGEAISPNSKARGVKGILKQIAGTGGPKTGMFHNKLLSKKQDFSARATIYAEPNLGFNEAAVPVDMLWTMYKFHILRDLAKQGYTWVDSEKAWSERTTPAQNSFNKLIKQIPVIINRAPTLMKSNVTSIYPVPHSGNAMGINPIHLPMFAADNDGDAFTLHLPMTPEAVEEAKNKLLPQHQIYDYRRGLGQALVSPAHEAILGSVFMTEPDLKQKTVQFNNEQECFTALRNGEITESTPVEIKA